MTICLRPRLAESKLALDLTGLLKFTAYSTIAWWDPIHWSGLRGMPFHGVRYRDPRCTLLLQFLLIESMHIPCPDIPKPH